MPSNVPDECAAALPIIDVINDLGVEGGNELTMLTCANAL